MEIDGLQLIEPRRYMERGYPHAEWRELRRRAPVAYFEPKDWQSFWAITKHADIIEISKQPERFLNGPGMTLIREEDARRAARAGRRVPDAHDHQHGPAGPPQVPQGGEPLVHAARARRASTASWRRRRAQLVDGLGREGECDFVRDVASLHPLKILASILGVPPQDEPFILRVTNELFGAEDPEFQRKDGDREANMRALGFEFFTYFNRVMESRRAQPRTTSPA